MQHETQTHRGTAGTAASNTGLFRERGLREDRGFEFPASESGSISSYSDFFGDAWRVMTIDHVQSSSEGPFKMQFCSDHSWLILNDVPVVFPLSCFAHVVLCFWCQTCLLFPLKKLGKCWDFCLSRFKSSPLQISKFSSLEKLHLRQKRFPTFPPNKVKIKDGRLGAQLLRVYCIPSVVSA